MVFCTLKLLVHFVVSVCYTQKQHILFGTRRLQVRNIRLIQRRLRCFRRSLCYNFHSNYILGCMPIKPQFQIDWICCWLIRRHFCVHICFLFGAGRIICRRSNTISSYIFSGNTLCFEVVISPPPFFVVTLLFDPTPTVWNDASVCFQEMFSFDDTDSFPLLILAISSRRDLYLQGIASCTNGIFCFYGQFFCCSIHCSKHTFQSLSVLSENQAPNQISAARTQLKASNQ